MDPAERVGKIPRHVGKRQLQCRRPSNQHVIMTGAKLTGIREPHDLAQPPPHPVALDRIADLPRYRETQPRRALVAAAARLQHKRLGGRPCTLGGCPKVRPAFQALHGADFWGRLGFGDPERRSPLSADARQSDANRAVKRSVTHSVSCAPAPGAPTTPDGRLWSPCGCESRGGACAPICSADRSVSRHRLRCARNAKRLMIGVRQAPWPAGLAARLARLIREASRLVNVTALACASPRSSPIGQFSAESGPHCHHRATIE